jgi:hypothetical protein
MVNSEAIIASGLFNLTRLQISVLTKIVNFTIHDNKYFFKDGMILSVFKSRPKEFFRIVNELHDLEIVNLSRNGKSGYILKLYPPIHQYFRIGLFGNQNEI